MVMCLAGVAVILAFLIPLALTFSFVIPQKLFLFPLRLVCHSLDLLSRACRHGLHVLRRRQGDGG